MPPETGAQDGRDQDRRLPLPPRAISANLSRYLTAATFQFWAGAFGFLLLPFWSTCGFGADVESLAFQARLRPATGVVTRFEPTGARVGFGSNPRGHQAPDPRTVPIYAVYFSYMPAGGARRAGVCFAPGAFDHTSVPFAEPLPPSGDFEEPPPNPPLTPGAAVSVQTVAGWPGLARIRGTATNLYPLPALIIAVFPGVFLLMLLRGRAVRCGFLHLVAVGREDAARGLLVAPAAEDTLADPAARDTALNSGALRRLVVQGDTLLPPPRWALRCCAWPLLALACNIWYIGTHAKTLFYPFKALLAH